MIDLNPTPYGGALNNMSIKKNLEITLGSDPELFLFDTKTSQIVNALTVLKKDKHDPIELTDGVKMYADNVLVEASFSPAHTPVAATMAIRSVLKACHNFVGNDYSLLPLCAHKMSGLPPKPSDELVEKWLEDKSGEVKGVPPEWQIGCNPNFDVYGGEFGAIRKQTPFRDELRSGSFHIHVGNSNYLSGEDKRLLTIESKVAAVKLMDLFVGLSEVVINTDSTSIKRRELYGRAGEFRPTKYGIEYRVLGNYALRHPKTTLLMFELTAFAMSMFSSFDLSQECINMHNTLEVQRAINTNDKTLALSILKESWLPASMFDRVRSQPDVTSFSTAKNWGL